MVVLDVDGILTDGKIVFTGPAEEAKHFSAQDGVGIRLAQRAGIGFGIITGRKSDSLLRRARELGITEIHLNSLHKADSYAQLRKTTGLDDEEIAYLGDDLVDMPILKRAGFAATVPEARPEVIRAAHFVSGRSGGDGAVREILDFILRVQGRWHRATRGFL
jgi:3-deoxy-D-manno-octulosonate 8-phosphate phosphatase (KDO 8-P phosphatase)